MAVIKMMALTLVGPNEEMETVAKRMVIMGGFQPLPMDLLLSDRAIRSKISTESANPYDELLTKLTSVWRVAGDPIPDPEPIAIDENFTSTRITKEVNTATRRLEIWDARKEALSEELDGMIAAKQCLEALTKLERNPAEIANTEFAIFTFGRTSIENFTKLQDSTEQAPLIAVDLNVSGGKTWGLVMTVPGYAESAKKLLDTVYFKEYSLSDIAAVMEEKNPLSALDDKIAMRKKAIAALAKAAKSLLKNNRKEYENLYSRAYTMQRVYDLCKGRGEISGLFVLSGWIPEDTLEAVRATVAKEAPRSAIMVEEAHDLPYKGVTIPTMLNNLPFVRPFQDIVRLYSLPAYGEIDPSFIVAITFSLFFGFMFGDVGHGAAIVVIAMFAQKKGMLKRSFATVLKTAGVMSMIFGVLYGSIFGLEHVIPALWMSPMENTGKLIGIAVGLGVIMISLGMILNIVTCYRAKDMGKLLFDGKGLAGLLFYWLAAALVFASITGITLPFPSWMASAGLTALLLIMLFKDVLARVILRQRSKHKEPFYMNFFEILHSMISFVSNTASFVRLAAFALNHVGLSLAVLMIADMVRNVPGGLFFHGLVLLIGNIIIIALEGLIVFIQTLRLEYYEFFSKFYRGGGNNFRPVGWLKPQKAKV